jgi:predicted dehydrogenase
MRFLVVGLGSMGKRRVRCLHHLGFRDVIAYDPKRSRCEEAHERYGIQTVTNFDAGMELGPEAIIISTPPDMHVEYGMAAARAAVPFFTEASVVDEGLDELIDLCRERRVVAAPSCTMRFHPSVRVVRDLVASEAIGAVSAFTYHSGQWLPDWHPWEDYREYYVSKRATGACREIVPFELVWLTWILGDVSGALAVRAKLSSLETDIDDVYQVLLKFSQGTLGHLLVDVIARVPFRTARFLGEQGVIEWVASEHIVRAFTAHDGVWTEYAEPAPIVEEGYLAAENMYIEETRAFVATLTDSTPYPYSLEEDRSVLRVLQAAEASPDPVQPDRR